MSTYLMVGDDGHCGGHTGLKSLLEKLAVGFSHFSDI